MNNRPSGVGLAICAAASVAMLAALPTAGNAQQREAQVRAGEPPPEPVVVTRDPWAGHTMRPRVALRPMFGFGGTARIDRVTENPDLATSYGGAIEIEVPLAPFFSLGGELALLAWTTDGDGQEFDLDRNLLTSISLVPRLRLPFEGDHVHGAMYLGVPVGVSINAMDDTFDPFMNITGADLGTGVGYNVGARVGAQVFFTPRIGLTAELEYRYHAFRHNVNGGILVDNSNIDMSIHQLVLQTGVVFTL
jgi:hypothetical protein